MKSPLYLTENLPSGQLPLVLWCSPVGLSAFNLKKIKNKTMFFFEKYPVEVSKLQKELLIKNPWTIPKFIQENQKITTCNRLELGTLGSWPILPKFFSGQCEESSTLRVPLQKLQEKRLCISLSCGQVICVGGRERPLTAELAIATSRHLRLLSLSLSLHPLKLVCNVSTM